MRLSNRPEMWIGGTSATIALVGSGFLIGYSTNHDRFLFQVAVTCAVAALGIPILCFLVLLVLEHIERFKERRRG